MDRNMKIREGEVSASEAFETFSRSSIAMVLTNPRLPDNPIVYVNDAFERVTGYSRDSALGRNCRFLQNERGDPEQLAALRLAVENEHEIAVDIRNFRADGTAFTNRLLVAPIHDAEGRLSHFLGIQKDLSDDEARRSLTTSDQALREIQHRVKNHLSKIVGLIRVQARQSSARTEYNTLARRVQSLQLLYEEMTAPSEGRNRDVLDLGAYLTRVANAIAHIDGRSGIRVNIDSDSLVIPVEPATRIGLVVSEVLTNAMQHAFVGRDRGLVELQVTTLGTGGVRITISDDGVGMPEEIEWPNPDSLGGRIVAGLIEGLDGSLDVTRTRNGTIVTLDIAFGEIQA